MSPTVLTALRHALEHDPGRPLVTFYDGESGERVELSVKTFCNWVDKIANLLSDELMLDPGEVVHFDLPTHWQSAVAIVGSWTAGLQVSLGTPPDTASVSVVGPAARAEPRRAVGQVLACSLRPMGGPFVDEPPTGWLDFAREVPPQPDVLLAPVEVTDDRVALVLPAAHTTHRDLVEQATRTAEEVGLTPAGRLITDANPARPGGLTAALLAPIVLDAGAVLVVNCDAEQRSRIAEQERVSAQFWLVG